MADGQFRLSRRALLGVACASPLLPRHPGLDPGPMNTVGTPARASAFMGSGLRRNDGWERALALFNRADALISALEGRSDDDTFNRAADAHDCALERLLLAPAPDVAALAAKLRLARIHQAWELSAGEAMMEALERDAVSLAF